MHLTKESLRCDITLDYLPDKTYLLHTKCAYERRVQSRRKIPLIPLES